MSTTPFMPLWVSDFVGDTLDLDAKEVGAYMLILMAMWGRGGRLPDDPKKLQRVARVGRDWPKVWAALERYFVAENGTITNKRLTLELHKVATKRAVNAHAGSLGGKAKALKEKEQALADATVSPKQPEPYLEIEKKGEAKASHKKAPSGSRLPENWALPREWGEWALSEGAPDQMIRAEAVKFRDYWFSVAGAKGRKADWQATWRNWMRKAMADQPRFSAINGGIHGQDAATERSNAKLESWMVGARSF